MTLNAGPGNGRTIREAFEEFDIANPHVYILFKRYAHQAFLAQNGGGHFGAKAVWERLRWELNIETSSVDEFKLNNNYTAYYARKYMIQFPQASGFFRTRMVRS